MLNSDSDRRKARVPYSEKYKAAALAPVFKAGRPVALRAKELKVHPSLLYSWMNKAGGRPSRSGLTARDTGNRKGNVAEKKVDVFKEKHSRKWSAKLTFPDGSTQRMRTEYTEFRKASMSAVSSWGKIARQKGLITTKTGRRPENDGRTFGLDKSKGHALLNGGGNGGGELQLLSADNVGRRAASPGERETRCRALVGVISAVETLDADEVLWVLRAAAAVTQMEGRYEGRAGRLESGGATA